MQSISGSSYSWICLTLNIVNILAQSFGLRHLFVVRSVCERFNVHVTLIGSLSAVEAFYSYSSVFTDVTIIMEGNNPTHRNFTTEKYHIPSIENYRRTNTEKYREAANRVTVCFTRPIIFVIMVLITSNRLFGTVYPFKYRLYATKKRFFCTMLCCSALAVSIVTLLALLNRFEETFLSVWFCCILTLYFVFCVFAYTKILAKLAESKQRVTKTTSNTSNEANTESQSLKRKNVVNFRLFQEGNNISLMIVCVYFVLIVIPYIVWSAICNWFKSVSLCHLWRGVVEIFFKLNCISDVFIYVLMDKQARNRLKRSLMKKVFSKQYQSRVFRSTTGVQVSVAAVGVYVVEDSNTTPTSTL